ncbi:stage II sporulation protein M [Actinomadura flavalba]|uniref:stage II sporulation protein M n=1 Tax=Actinomadura flavalba TaxID=1120938 RepID=UPI00037B91C9|nr:stage II sporulation protein M [Actinomadura flavalba]
MRFFRQPLRIVRANLRAYIGLNALMYGLFVVGMVAALAFPDLHEARTAGMDDDGTTDRVGELLGNPALFALMIFAINVFTAAAGSIVLPSMIVPFAGIAVFAYRAFTFGLTLAPVDEDKAKTMIPHSLTILIEFQAYVLVLLGAYLLGKAWVRPRSVGAENRRRGYLWGLRQIGRLSLPALVLFVIGAIYEAVELAYLVPPLVRG